jgi:hypothetical protein
VPRAAGIASRPPRENLGARRELAPVIAIARGFLRLLDTCLNSRRAAAYVKMSATNLWLTIP